MPALRSLILSARLPLILVLNLALWCTSFVAALGLRFDFQWAEIRMLGDLQFLFALLVTLRAASYIAFSLNQGYWRYTSTDDLLRIFLAHGVSSVLMASAIWFGQLGSFPRSVIFIEFCLSLLLCGGSRFIVRMMCEYWMRGARGSDGATKDVLVLGAGDSGHLLIKTLLSSKRLAYRPVGVLDDNTRLRGLLISGVKVLGSLSDLRATLETNKSVCAVLLAIPSLSSRTIDAIQSVCSEVGVPLKRIQSFEDIAFADAQHPVPSLSIESVLERDVDPHHEGEVTASIAGKVVVVTGAGGSIGSELVRQILPFAPKRLILIDNNEFHMYRIEREIVGLYPSVKKEFVIANIVNETRLDEVFDRFKPEILFHAAAYKHVPLMEENVYEAFNNNVVGTRNLIRSAIKGGVRHFVFISTDKAVNSCSVMGHSKRIGELLLQSFTRASQNQSGQGITSAIVRFGNVLNSNGSVVPLFKEQILSGGPVTVTHPDMVRFFMSIKEAVRLVLAAGTLGRTGEIFLLDMGKPVKIVEVARKMLALYGRRDIPIVFTGTRPGERLFEELTGFGEVKNPTKLSKVTRVVGPENIKTDVRDWVSFVEKSLTQISDREIAKLMHDFVREVSGRPEEEVVAPAAHG